MLSNLFYILAIPFGFSPDKGSDLAVLPTGPLLLNPNGDTGFCLDVQNGVFANGTPVQMYVVFACPVRMPFSDGSLFHGFGNSFKCNGTPAQKWSIMEGNTKVQVSGTNFCLDASSSEWTALTTIREIS